MVMKHSGRVVKGPALQQASQRAFKMSMSIALFIFVINHNNK